MTKEFESLDKKMTNLFSEVSGWNNCYLEKDLKQSLYDLKEDINNDVFISNMPRTRTRINKLIKLRFGELVE